MSDFISTMEAIESSDFNGQKIIREEVVGISTKIRAAMDEGLTVDEMTKAREIKQAADAAAEILSHIF